MSNSNVHALDPNEITVVDVAPGVDRDALLRVITGRPGGISYHDDTGLPASMSFYHSYNSRILHGDKYDGVYIQCTTVVSSHRRPDWAAKAPGCWSSQKAYARRVKKPKIFEHQAKVVEVHTYWLGTVKFRGELYSVHLSRVPGSPGTPAGFPQ